VNVAYAHSPAFVRLVEDAKSRIRHYAIDEFLQRLQSGERFILLDVREDAEWARGRLPGAHHLAKGVLEREIEGLVPDPEVPMVLYCGDGFRSALAADSLQRMGYSNVASLDGGWLEWNERGLPTTQAAPGSV